MRILVTGATGHAGSYLVPRLVLAGHQVTALARRPVPQWADPRLAWPAVEWIVADRTAEEQTDAWRRRMDAIDVDVVIDLICYSPAQNRTMVDAFAGRIQHFLHCGTIWAYGPPDRVPYRESDPRRPIDEYGRNKAAIEAELIELYRTTGFPATIIHPGHISGRKWLPIDPQGTRDGVEVYRKLAHGDVVYLPAAGQQTIHHIHSDDLAQLFELAMIHRAQALGESFSAVTAYALSLVGCCRFVASLFGREPNLAFASQDEMPQHMGDGWLCTKDHIDHNPCCSIAHGQRLLGYQPRFTTEEIYVESIECLLESGQLVI